MRGSRTRESARAGRDWVKAPVAGRAADECAD